MDGHRQRRGLPRRIGLIGAECSGKSTLALALAQHLDGTVVTEELRRFVDEHGRPPRRSEQAGIMRRQIAAEDAAANTCTTAWLVGDPAPLMTAVYSLDYFQDDSLMAEALHHAQGYDLLVWCAPDVDWLPDGPQRDGPEQRLRTDTIIADICAGRLSATDPQALPVSGPVATRVAAVLQEASRRAQAWQPRGPQPPP